MNQQVSIRASVVEAARRAIGPVGALLPVTFTEAPSVHAQVAAVRTVGTRRISLHLDQ